MNRPIIRQLDPHTVNQIAAGEVVERPASVVKELVENALDAGARRIDVELRDAGRTLIRVSDNGCGMDAASARLALQRHATSKIQNPDDLQHVMSLGFRGEALPSIASVSRMRIATADDDSGHRTEIAIDGGDIGPDRAVTGPQGTEITVEDLFFNTPARLKFLKSDTTELGQAIDHVARYAIANPAVAFRITHNGQVALETFGRDDPLEAIAGAWGRDAARTLAEIRTDIGGLALSGFVSPPHVTKPSRAFQFIYVNGRPVRSRNLTTAVDVAFRDITPDRRYPLLVLNIAVDPTRIDVNVSPTKSEVRFQQEGQAFDAIRLALKGALMEHGMMPSAAQIMAANQALAAAMPITPIDDFRLTPSGTESPTLPHTGPVFDLPVAPKPVAMPFVNLLEGLRIIGQAMNTFIVAETASGVVIIDQHVAHERILYEYLCGIRGQAAMERQPLLVPQTLELDKRSAVLIREKLEEIRAVGFDIEPFGGESYVVRGVPAAIKGKDPIRILRDMVEELVETSVQRRLVPTREQIWITTSCKMAVKAGDPLSHAEMEKLVLDLATTENPYLCPHGRPITITLSRDAMLRMFKRT